MCCRVGQERGRRSSYRMLLHIYTYTHTYIHTHIHIYIHIYQVHTMHIHSNTHRHARSHPHTQQRQPHKPWLSLSLSLSPSPLPCCLTYCPLLNAVLLLEVPIEGLSGSAAVASGDDPPPRLPDTTFEAEEQT